MMDELLAGGPVDDEIAPGDDIAIERHQREKEGGEDNRQRACNRDQEHSDVALLFHGQWTFLLQFNVVFAEQCSRSTQLYRAHRIDPRLRGLDLGCT